ncbi:hypothetical protein M758_10G007100 [Ceratodon purpureus]|nr:hypothetical protein M758_10G007100 [Ceratodon purpureus]
MRREGRLRGTPTNKSRRTGGRCRLGRDRCFDHLSGKSWEKRKHRCKRFATDLNTNPDLADFFLVPALTLLRGGYDDEEYERSFPRVEEDEGAVQLAILDVTVNSMIEAAFIKLHRGKGGGFEAEEYAAMAFTSYEIGGGARIDHLADDAGLDIAAIELAFQRQLGIFENAVEGSGFSEFATQGWSTLSEESWSEVELSESDDENSADDWSVVDLDED